MDRINGHQHWREEQANKPARPATVITNRGNDKPQADNAMHTPF